MSKIGALEAKIQFPALLERVQKGEYITITERGDPIALLVPAHQRSSPELSKSRSQVIADIKEFGRGRSLPVGLTVRDLIAEGRRFN